MNCGTATDPRNVDKNYACRKTPSQLIDLTLSTPAARDARVSFVLTNRGFQIYGKWNSAEVLGSLRDRLSRCINSATETAINSDDGSTRLQSIVYSGLYSCRVLRELERKGMLPHNIMRAMKLGLVSLPPNELAHFEEFQLLPCALYVEDTWDVELDEELITNLRACCLNDSECWSVIKYGVVTQSPRILYRLMSSGIDVPGILDWQSRISSASPKMIIFLKGIGMEESVVELVERYGIDEETREMLIDLGYTEAEDKEAEEVVCKCSLEELKTRVASLASEEMTDSDSVSTRLNTEYSFDQFACKCEDRKKEETIVELTAQRNDYLRQNVMVPLAWSMARALNYRPSDPQYYMAYQLVRWKFGTVPWNEMEAAREYVATATVKMDRQLVMKRLEEEEENVRARNEEVIRNIPCESCKYYPEARVVKKLCSKCYKKSKVYEPCEFPLSCSRCKIELTDVEVMK